MKSTETPFLPIDRDGMNRCGWNGVDVVLVTGDAYVDHPAFGAAVIGRVLEAAGYRVGIIAMPDRRDPAAMTVFGRPRLFFGVTSGNTDSMISNYTAFKRPRRDDPYVPEGRTGRRPDRAVIVYANLIRQVYRDVPIVLGGIEASMRRMAHYDFWDDRVRRSILLDSRATAVVYGMAESSVIALAGRMERGEEPVGIPNTVTVRSGIPEDAVLLPDEAEVLGSRSAFLEFYRQFYTWQHSRLVQHSGNRFLVHEPPDSGFRSEDLDRIYALPFTRRPHPVYEAVIPAYEMIRDSVTSHRGCVSGCSFCSLTLHQGRRIVSRSPKSVLNEVGRIASAPDFRGHITDIGGPSANMYGFGCEKDWVCGRESCLFPGLCPNLRLSGKAWPDLLERASRIPNVRRVTVGSGIRYDVFMLGADPVKRLRRLVRGHVSGQLKIAPEHTDPAVLRAMRKTPLYDLDRFIRDFREADASAGKTQFLIPYLMSNHPGSTAPNMRAMRRAVRRQFRFTPEQVQAFIPLPMTLSSVIHYTGEDPLTGETFPVTRDPAARRRQHAVFFGKTAGRSSRRRPSPRSPDQKEKIR
ncbi:MAG TPA: YgiQ family radical SAM protein [bacterium]|nr:YgiQ family radical SAM protein [bacterium]